MSSPYKILAITTAQPGWVSVYADSDGPSYLPVALWAIVEDEHGQRTAGISGAGDVLLPDDQATNFEGWEYAPAAYAACGEHNAHLKK